jgi:hypothetical protein
MDETGASTNFHLTKESKTFTETSCFFQILHNGESPETASRIICVNSAIFREVAVRILVEVIRNFAGLNL